MLWQVCVLIHELLPHLVILKALVSRLFVAPDWLSECVYFLSTLPLRQVALRVKRNELFGLLLRRISININHTRVVLQNIVELDLLLDQIIVLRSILEDHSDQGLAANANVLKHWHWQIWNSYHVACERVEQFNHPLDALFKLAAVFRYHDVASPKYKPPIKRKDNLSLKMLQ